MTESDKNKVRSDKCNFCTNPEEEVSYQDITKLKRYLNEREMIIPRQKSRLCSYHQRKLASTIKKARFLSLLSVGGKKNL